MTPVQTSLAWSVGLLLGMLICLEIGYRIGSYGVEKHLDLAHEGTGTIEAAVFALPDCCWPSRLAVRCRGWKRDAR